jgi:DNA-binding CsgD family transcriptional regulator
MDEADFSEIIDGIYDAATTYSLWQEAMDRLGRVFGCCCVSLIERDLTTMKGRATAVGVDLDSQREFFDVWGKRNILVHRTRAWRAGRIETDLDLMPKDDLLRSDYYNGFMKPRDMHAIMRLTLSEGTFFDGGDNQCLSLVRSEGAGDYTPADIARFRPFVPHLQRAARIGAHLEKAHTMLDGVTDMLDRNPAGIVLLNRAGKIVFSNGAAQAMARAADGFVLKRDRIAALDHVDDTALQALIAGATSRNAPAEIARGGAVRLTRPSGGPAFNAVIGPLAGTDTWREAGPVAFVLITDPADAGTPPENLLAQLFGFSPTEVRVAERLMMGDSPEQLAEALAIRISTARWHLASLYRKTGTNRQAELVRLLLSLPITRPSLSQRRAVNGESASEAVLPASWVHIPFGH